MYVKEESLSVQLRSHVCEYGDLLRSKTRSYLTQSHQYLCGLFQSGKRNIEQMSETVPDTDYQRLHHFISESPWDWEPVLDRLNLEAYGGLVGGQRGIGYIIDESGWKKQGDHSVGVARQYLGSLGKVDNGQVAVVGSLCRGRDALLVDFSLYLPQSWTSAASRCEKAQIPASDRAFLTKVERAHQLVQRAWDRGLELDWVGADAAYGHDSKFRRWLDEHAQFYVLDIHANDQVYLEDPCPYLPTSSEGKGRPRSRLQTDHSTLAVEHLWQQMGREHAELCGVRPGSKGLLKRKVWTREVYTWDGKQEQARQETLIVSVQPDGANIKYSLANNQIAQLSDKELLFRQMQRFWVEQSIKEAKSELGMHHYQVRNWVAWHHHMTLTCMALLFMHKIRMSKSEEQPLLSCNDIRTILVAALPQKMTNEQIAWEIIRARHKKRQEDIDRFYPK